MAIKQTLAITSLAFLLGISGTVVQLQAATPTNVPNAENSTDTPSPKVTSANKNSPTPTDSATDDKAVEDLKAKVENSVSNLKEKNSQTKSGFVTSVGDNQLKVDSDEGSFEVVIEGDVTQAFKISGGKTVDYKVEDVKKGDYILVSGPEIGNSVTANSIYVDSHYIVKSGIITEVNSDSFYIKIQTLEKDEFTLDIEKTTKMQLIDIKDLKLSSMGFSQLKEGDSMHFTAQRGSDAKQNRFSILSAVTIPQEYFQK